MKLADLQTVLDILSELEPAAERFSWGPTLSLAKKRQDVAIKLVKRAIKEVSAKTAEFEKLKGEIEEFIAQHEISNHHYLHNEVIVAQFSTAKENQVRKAIKELR